MDLKVTLVQPDLVWEHKEANLARLSGMLDAMGTTDVVVLPEMFSTGFSMNAGKLAEEMDGQTVRWMTEKSRDFGAMISGSLIIIENGRYYNRFIWATPNGKLLWYDKKHLFSMGEEHLHYSPGDRRITIEWKGWKIRPLVCYDLRFPVWSRNHDDYDLLVYTANWPSPRHAVWKTLLQARALENQCYCIGVNRIGNDGLGIGYLGDSGLITPKGEATWLGILETSRTFTISLGDLHRFREKFPVLKDRDRFKIED